MQVDADAHTSSFIDVYSRGVVTSVVILCYTLTYCIIRRASENNIYMCIDGFYVLLCYIMQQYVVEQKA